MEVCEKSYFRNSKIINLSIMVLEKIMNSLPCMRDILIIYLIHFSTVSIMFFSFKKFNPITLLPNFNRKCVTVHKCIYYRCLLIALKGNIIKSGILFTLSLEYEF
jgi:hypothetical protein